MLPRANRSRAGLAAEEVEDLGETGRHPLPQGAGRTARRAGGAPRASRPHAPPAPPHPRRQRADEAVLVETPEVELVNGRSRDQEETPAIISTNEVETVAAEPRRRTRRTAPAQAAPVIDSVEPVVARAPMTEPTAEPKPIMEATPVTETATEQAPVQAPSFLSTPEPPAPEEPERIIPASPFSVIFQSPDLATDDDDIAPSAATERKQQRRQPRGGAPGGRDGGNRRRMGEAVRATS